MKIYLVRSCWYADPHRKPMETKAFKTKESMRKAYEDLCNARDEDAYENIFHRKRDRHFECRISDRFRLLNIYSVDNKTNKKDLLGAWSNVFDEVDLQS